MKVSKANIYFLYRIIKTSFRYKKLWNAAKINFSYILSRFGVLKIWDVSPIFISIEPVDICNLHCPECPVGIRDIPRKGTSVNLEVTRKLIDELSPRLMHTILYFQGEPLINRDFPEIVKYIRSKNILTSTSTNAQLLNDKMAKAIVESGLDKLIVSIDGTTQETYEKYRVGGKLEKATQAIEYINKWKKELNSYLPFVEIQFIVFKTNEHQMADMKKMAHRLEANKLTFKTAQLYDFENGHELLPDNKKYARYELKKDGKYHIKSPLRNSCKRLWQGSVMTSRGDILPCCFDKDSDFTLGNVPDESFDSIWKNKKSNHFRKAILSDRKQFEMCRNCTEK